MFDTTKSYCKWEGNVNEGVCKYEDAPFTWTVRILRIIVMIRSIFLICLCVCIL